MKVSLVFVPFPAISHLVPMVELAKTLILRHNKDPDHQISITVLRIPPLEPSPQIASYISSVAAGSGEGISFRELPELDPSLLANASRPDSFLSTVMDFQKPHVRATIQDVLLASPVPAVIVDMLCLDMIYVAGELGVPSYVFLSTGATCLGFMLYLSTLDALLPVDKDMEELQDDGITIDLPGFSSPVPPMVLPEPFLQRKEGKHMWFVHVANRYVDAKGFIINSCMELQPRALKTLEEGGYSPHHPTPPVFPVGPLLSLNSDPASNADGRRNQCLRWLDGQPRGSVVFLCFGSMGCLSKAQATEASIGLEKSGHRFLWVLRSPSPEKSPVTLATDADPVEVLPEGFLERTRDRGMVWPKSAPQTAILGHGAVGGFVTHCGWSSILEGVWFGVPMLAWPLKAEQHLNAFEMVTEMGIATELKIDRKAENWVTADEMERGVRCLMGTDATKPSRDTRSKVMEMSQKAREAVMEGGPSFRSTQNLTKLLLSTVPSRP